MPSTLYDYCVKFLLSLCGVSYILSKSHLTSGSFNGERLDQERAGGVRLSKIYVLDTNVLLQDPYSIFSFEDNEVVIPAVVLEEVDSKKDIWMKSEGTQGKYHV